ncbi:DUF805 domain-containing protein [Sphingopyxis sp. BSNA05]|uniref:DUF805 domain-containing protein n=1 Tax=Sphingopyxis sp. BSNA05 TaxID=1236614 RepID=UPI0015659716|nr:DUF805 domain-containing protein [Sphingopyxis sp. BSNA05]
MNFIRNNRIGRFNYLIFLLILSLAWVGIEFQIFGRLNLMLNLGFRSDPANWDSQDIRLTALQIISDGLLALFTVRRLHDANRSGWFLSVAIIGLVLASYVHIGFVIAVVICVLVILFLPSTIGPNKYGPDPRGWKSREQFDEQEKMLAEQQKNRFGILFGKPAKLTANN